MNLKQRIQNSLHTPPTVVVIAGMIVLLLVLGAVPMIFPSGPWFPDRPIKGRTSGNTGQGPTLIITTLEDLQPVRNGSCEQGCSLRQALAYAPQDAVLRFAPELQGALVLHTQLDVNRDVTIVGPTSNTGLPVVAISGGFERFGRSGTKGLMLYGSVALTFENLILTQFSGWFDGGGVIYNEGGWITLENCIIRDNAALFKGGGAIYNKAGTVIIKHSVLEQNQAGLPLDRRFDFNTKVYRGGAIYNEAGQITLMNSAIVGNQSAGDAGGIYNDHGTLLIADTLFSGNTANGLPPSTLPPAPDVYFTGLGGGLYNERGTVHLVRSAFRTNSALYNGGGLYNNNGGILIGNTTFSENVAGGHGGGIYNSRGKISVTNATLTENTAGSILGGGAIFSAIGLVTVTNTILANNGHTDCRGSTVDAGNNLQFPGQDCGLFIPIADPKLDKAPVRDPRYDRSPAATSIRALLTGSPAIDAGNDAACAAEEIGNVDQRSAPRSVDGGSGKPRCDIGAFEYNSTPPSATPTAAPSITIFVPYQ